MVLANGGPPLAASERSGSSSYRERVGRLAIYEHLARLDTAHEIAKHRAPSIVDAILEGHFAQVRFLIGLGTNVNAPGTERSLDYRSEATPLIVCARVRGNHWGVGLAQNLLEAGALVGRVDRLGMNALHHACIYGRYRLARLFLKSLDFDLNAQDMYGNTALHYAAEVGHVQLVELLVDAARRLGVSTSIQNRAGFTPLLVAARQGHRAVSRVILEATSTNSTGGGPGPSGQLESNNTDPKYGRTAEEWLAIAEEREREEEARRSERELRRLRRFDDPTFYSSSSSSPSSRPATTTASNPTRASMRDTLWSSSGYPLAPGASSANASPISRPTTASVSIRSRPVSAAVSTPRSNRSRTASRSDPRRLRDDETPVVAEQMRSLSPIRMTRSNDRRNDPVYVFRQTPLDVFAMAEEEERKRGLDVRRTRSVRYERAPPRPLVPDAHSSGSTSTNTTFSSTELPEHIRGAAHMRGLVDSSSTSTLSVLSPAESRTGSGLSNTLARPASILRNSGTRSSLGSVRSGRSVTIREHTGAAAVADIHVPVPAPVPAAQAAGAQTTKQTAGPPAAPAPVAQMERLEVGDAALDIQRSSRGTFSRVSWAEIPDVHMFRQTSPAGLKEMVGGAGRPSQTLMNEQKPPENLRVQIITPDEGADSAQARPPQGAVVWAPPALNGEASGASAGAPTQAAVGEVTRGPSASWRSDMSNLLEERMATCARNYRPSTRLTPALFMLSFERLSESGEGSEYGYGYEGLGGGAGGIGTGAAQGAGAKGGGARSGAAGKAGARGKQGGPGARSRTPTRQGTAGGSGQTSASISSSSASGSRPQSRLSRASPGAVKR